MKSGVVKSRKAIPLARSIRWVPAGTFTPPRTIDDLALFIAQGALRDVLRHLGTEPGRELVGFLLGELYDCPETGARYVVVDAAIATEHEIPNGDPVLLPEEVWLGAQREARRRQTQLLGWYHGGTFVGTHPDPLDLEAHRAYFTEPWQYGLVIASAGEPAGGFFRPLLGEAAGGGVFTPFHELLDAAPPRASGREPKRTLIDWTNYVPQEPVEHERAGQAPPAPPPSAPPLTSPAPQPPQQAPTPARGVADERPEAAPAADGGSTLRPLVLPSPAELEAMLAAAQPPPRRSRAAIAAAVLLTAVAAAAAGLYWYRGRVIDLPGGAGEYIRQISAGQLPSTHASPQLGDSAPAFIPPVGTPSTSAPTPQPQPQPPAPASHTAVLPAPTTDPAVLRFDTLADTLEQAVRNFRDRGADFALNRLTCDGLAVGYRSADVAFIALASAHRTARDALDSAREARYQRLEGQMRGVNEEFDSSKCPRP